MKKKKYPLILALALSLIGISATFPILHSCSNNAKSTSSTNSSNNNNSDNYTIELKDTEFQFSDINIKDVDQDWIKKFLIENKDTFFKISGNLSQDFLNEGIEISNFKKENNTVTFDLIIKNKEQVILEQKAITFSGLKNDNQPTSKPMLDDIINSFQIEKKLDKDLSRILASDINKDNFKQYFDVKYPNVNNLKIDYQFTVDDQDSSILNVEIVLTMDGQTKSIKKTFSGFKKIVKNNITLKQTSFKASLFGWSETIASDAKDSITSDWIFENKNTLFDIEGEFNKADITIPPMPEVNENKISVAFQVFGNKIIEFKITDFKEEFSNKEEQLANDIHDVVELVKSDDPYFDPSKLTVDKFIKLDYEVQKKFFNFNWKFLDETFKDNDLWKSPTNPNGISEMAYTVKVSNDSPTEAIFTINIYVGDEVELTKEINIDGFLQPTSSFDETQLNTFVNNFVKNFKLIPSEDPNYNYRNLNVEQFLKLDTLEQERYFQWNYDELQKIFPNFKNHCLYTFNVQSTFKHDQSTTAIDFDVYIIFCEKINSEGFPQNILTIKMKPIPIEGFDNIFEEVTGLDAAKIEKLTTPNQATPYKGKLKRFRFKDIEVTGNNAYDDLIKNLTWEDFKAEMAYQVRFALYQMFSDNFSEVNYYISNDIENQKLTATAIGLIKETRENVNYYFQYLGDVSKQTTSVTSGDKIEISITYDASNQDWKPVCTSDEGILPGLNLNFWNFKDNCEGLNNPSDPYYLSPTFINLISGNIILSIKKNDESLYNKSVNHFAYWSFNWLKTRPKK